MPVQFDIEGFYGALDRQRRARSLSWSGVGREAGLSPQALHRVTRGYTPRIDSLIKLLTWLGTPGDMTRFLKPDEPQPSEP